MKKGIFYILLIVFANISVVSAQTPVKIHHTIAAIEQGRFYGWPANNGVWQWGDTILVGYTQGNFAVKEGHNIIGNQESMFSRSPDGGETWSMFDPDDFLDDENELWLPKGKKYLEHKLNFEQHGFALRVFAQGYHGNKDPEGGFYYSYDYGSTWQGPYFLGNLNNHKNLKNYNISARTDYIVMGKNGYLIFISANPGDEKSNRIACIKTEDGGLQFEFVSWVTSHEEQVNAIMSNTLQVSENKFILVYRKIYHETANKKHTIETYVSEDNCRTWRFLSTVKIMESGSNPPALVMLNDGRLCCIYGDRHNRKMCGKYSIDEGGTWGKEFIIRDHFKGLDEDSDFGYPRLVQRNDGKLVAIYYWASPEHLQQHIAVSIWEPSDR